MKKRLGVEKEPVEKNTIVIKSHWVEELLDEDFAGKKGGQGRSAAMISIKKRNQVKRHKIQVAIPSKPEEF